MGEFVFVDPSVWSDERHDPLSQARLSFLRKDFGTIISVLEPVLAESKYSEEYLKACATNLAAAYHVMGYYDEAKSMYAQCDDTVMRAINYYAFCHRFFEYKKIQAAISFYRLCCLLEHNKLNYYLNVFGTDEAIEFWNGRSVNIYDEQIFNDIRIRRGLPISVNRAVACENDYHRYVGSSNEKSALKVIRPKIGIFLTDLQRHKDSAMLYQIIDELQDKFEIIVYFNNIFKNKLIKSFEERVCVRYIANMFCGEIISLMQADAISLLIDTAEYGLRNNSIAVSNCGIKRILLSDLLNVVPIIISSSEYFSNVVIANKIHDVLVLGDLRYLKRSELEIIKRRYGGRDIVFESHALDEPAFMENFYGKLERYGFNMRKTFLKNGVRPFSDYMTYISSFTIILLIDAATNAELSEVIKSGTSYEFLSTDQFEKHSVSHNNSLTDIIMELAEVSDLDKFSRRHVAQDHILCYLDNNRHYCVNCTCNGDLLIFDDIIQDRHEYSGCL